MKLSHRILFVGFFVYGILSIDRSTTALRFLRGYLPVLWRDLRLGLVDKELADG